MRGSFLLSHAAATGTTSDRLSQAGRDEDDEVAELAAVHEDHWPLFLRAHQWLQPSRTRPP
eukprot:3092272-Prymnesium_polylepis.2